MIYFTCSCSKQLYTFKSQVTCYLWWPLTIWHKSIIV